MKAATINILAIILLVLTLSTAAQAQIAVFVNKNNPMADISMKMLERAYLGKTTVFSDGQNIVLAEYAPLMESFFESVLGMTLNKAKVHWLKLILSGGTAIPPTKFDDVEDNKKFVMHNRGAISFMDMADADDTVKILTIDGKSPSAEDYPLK